jgi:hypothetical protein
MCPLDRIRECSALMRAETEHAHEDEQGDEADENAGAFGE